jgi:hypothetical protein
MQRSRIAPTNSGVFDTPQRFEQTMINTNQQTDSIRGSGRIFTEGPEADRFRDAMHGVARKLLFSTRAAADQQFLRDVLRDRYPGRWLHRLATLCGASLRPEHHGLLDETLAQFSMPDGRPMTVAIAFDYELEAQAQCDLAQREFERFPSPETKATVMDRLTTHILALKKALRSVHAMDVQ